MGNMSAQEFVDTVTGDLFGSRVFVFTPKGEVYNFVPYGLWKSLRIDFSLVNQKLNHIKSLFFFLD